MVEHAREMRPSATESCWGVFLRRNNARANFVYLPFDDAENTTDDVGEPRLSEQRKTGILLSPIRAPLLCNSQKAQG